MFAYLCDVQNDFLLLKSKTRNEMNREEIKKILPHREPMLLVDESEKVGDEVFSKYTIRENEFFTQGHFPGYPIVPGVILCEIMAQASFLLIPSEDLVGNTALYAGLDNVKFKNSVFPGDTVCVKARATSHKGPLVVVEAEARVNDKLVSKGRLSFMLVPNSNLKK